jgi:molybdopterin-guanine dinucleotide biosynthesis protein A
VPVLDGHRQVHAAAFRRAARPALLDAFEQGERSLTRALDELDVVTVDHLAPEALRDVDRPEDLRGGTDHR